MHPHPSQKRTADDNKFIIFYVFYISIFMKGCHPKGGYLKLIQQTNSFSSFSGSDYHGVGPAHLGKKPCITLFGLIWRGLMLSDIEACTIGWVV